MKEVKTFSKYKTKEKILVGDIVEAKELLFSPKYITIRDNTLNVSRVVETDVRIIYLQRVDKIGIGLDCHVEIKVDLVSEQLPKSDCSIWFEDEEGFVYLPNVKKIDDSVGNCCFAEIQGETEQIESSMVIINKETVFREAVDDFLRKNGAK